MNISRKLAEGVAGWLMYELHSSRNQLFSEKYLTTPIGNILNGIHGHKITSEFNHPILNFHKMGAGRPPQIDFIIRKNNSITVAVESKWFGQSRVNVGDIIWDLIRLELLADAYGTKCYFILAGNKRDLQTLFRSDRFLEKKSNNQTRPVLRLQKNVKKTSMRLDTPDKNRALLIKSKLLQYANVLMPSVLKSNYPEFYPKDCRNTDFQVYVWEIFPSGANGRFLPVNNSNYQ